MAKTPDFDQLLKVLNNEVPDRATLFELFINSTLASKLCNYSVTTDNMPQGFADAFLAAGYDYCTFWGYGLIFETKIINRDKSISLNEGAPITNWDDFEQYNWPSASRANYAPLEEVKLSGGAKIIAHGPNGVLENITSLMGYDNLCLQLYDNPELVQAVADRVGAIMLSHYQKCLEYKKVGACVVNDDWGFQQQPMIDPDSIRKYIMPWHKKIVEEIHAAGKPAIMHSCGNLFDCNLIEDVINICRFDAKHSFEDKIVPVEDAYEIYQSRIAILGGIDLDFLCRSTPDAIRKRCLALLERVSQRGGYALGSGNSIPDYVPHENYFAMINSVNEL